MSASTRTVAATAQALAIASYGVVSRRQLAAVGIDRNKVARHVAAGRWRVIGLHSVHVLAAGWDDVRSPVVAAVHDAGQHAWADGTSALVLRGLRGWQPAAIDVSVPRGARSLTQGSIRSQTRAAQGWGRDEPEWASRSSALSPWHASGHATGAVKALGLRRHHASLTPPLVPKPVPCSRPEFAALRAAAWARTPTEASTVLAVTIQQRLVRPAHLAEALSLLPKLRRRALIRQVVQDLAGGSESLGELDFIALCRRRGLPLPARQVVRARADGHYYLDVRWAQACLVVEIDGAHHYVGDQPIADALRQNDIALEGDIVLRVPVLALRTNPDRFFRQIEHALRRAGVIA